MRIDMRFKRSYPVLGDRKEVKRFLLFPLTIRDRRVKETRWLEFATIKYKYIPYEKGKKWLATGFAES